MFNLVPRTMTSSILFLRNSTLVTRRFKNASRERIGVFPISPNLFGVCGLTYHSSYGIKNSVYFLKFWMVKAAENRTPRCFRENRVPRNFCKKFQVDTSGNEDALCDNRYGIFPKFNEINARIEIEDLSR